MPDRITGVCPGCQNPGAPIVNGCYVPHILFLAEPDPETGQMVVICEGSELPMRECRVCGCTEEDCAQCIVKTGMPCSWVEDDLCSACTGADYNRSLAIAEAHDTVVSIVDYIPGNYSGTFKLEPAEWKNEILGVWEEHPKLSEEDDEFRRRR